jgi:alpha-tubulin suppressor-like RCC1 family protein
MRLRTYTKNHQDTKTRRILLIFLGVFVFLWRIFLRQKWIGFAVIVFALVFVLSGQGVKTQDEQDEQESALMTTVGTVTAIAAGRGHSVALKDDGTVYTWGRNDYGQVGDGTTTNRFTPYQVTEIGDAVAIAAGKDFTLVLKRDSTVWGWGRNDDGQLGDGTTTNHSTPAQVMGGQTGVIAIYAGQYHSFARKSDGTVWGWGYNKFGQLGDGTTTNQLTPVQLTGLADMVAFAGGIGHTLALKNDGTVWSWGLNNYGQLGDGTTTDRPTLAQVAGLTGIVAVAAGGLYSVAQVLDRP